MRVTTILDRVSRLQLRPMTAVAHQVLPDSLAEKVLGIARGRLRGFHQLSESDQRELAQETVERVLLALRSGAVTNVEAYTRRVAFHCAVDALRLRRRFRETDADPTDPHTPETLLASAQRHSSDSGLQGALADLVRQAPANYRSILEQHYWEGASLDTVVERELQRSRQENPKAEGPSRTQARNRVYAWHSRALKWLQSRLDDQLRSVLE